MQIPIENLRIEREIYDVLIGEYTNPLTKETKGLILGVYTIGEYVDEIKSNGIKIESSSWSNYSSSDLSEGYEYSYREATD